MSGTRSKLVVATLACVAASVMSPLPAADLERGRALYGNHCRFCHNQAVHNRQQRWPADSAQLRAVIVQWQSAQNLRWSSEEIEDVFTFLNVTQYNY